MKNELLDFCVKIVLNYIVVKKFYSYWMLYLHSLTNTTGLIDDFKIRKK